MRPKRMMTEARTKEAIKQQFLKAQEELERSKKQYDAALEQFTKAELEHIEASDFVRRIAANLGPMDDVVFHQITESTEAMEEIISAVLGVEITIKSKRSQYVISNIGVRGVRLDFAASIVPRVMITAQFNRTCKLGPKGALVNIEIQKSDLKDSENRVFFNGASLILDNTPQGIENYNEVTTAIVIYLSSFDVFKKGRMFYQTVLKEIYTGIEVKRPVTEIYINTENIENANPDDEHMGNIAEMLKLFKDKNHYDNIRFPAFSKMKHELMETKKGRLKLSKELQMAFDKYISEHPGEIMEEYMPDLKAKIDEEARIRIEEEIKAQMEQEARAEMEEVRAKMEQEARIRIEEEVKTQMEQEARIRIEEVKAQMEQEARAEMEEVRAKMEQEVKARMDDQVKVQMNEQAHKTRRDILDVIGQLLRDGRVEELRRATENDDYYSTLAAEYQFA